MDPTSGRPRWMSSDVINAEASGNFLVLSFENPESKKPHRLKVAPSGSL